MSAPRLTKKLKRALTQRAIEGAIRQIVLLNPEFDRPAAVDIEICVRPHKGVKYLALRECYQMP